MTTTLEAANEAMRRAVKDRLDNTDPSDDKLIGYDRETMQAAADFVQARKEFREWKQSGQPRGADEWQKLHDELHQLHVEKTAQYGHEESAFANIEASALCGVEPWRRCLCDLSDCVVRMQRYANGQPVDWENALKDAAMWAMLCLLMLRREDA